MTNYLNTVLYIGVTSTLKNRVSEHREGFKSTFCSKYKFHKLVYFEMHDDILFAIQREKRIKRWKRKWKENLINNMNPEWKDLFDQIQHLD